MPEADWDSVLADFRQHLRDQSDVIDAGRYDELRAFRIPPALGPLPARLESEAAGLLSLARAITERVARARARCGQQLAVTRVAARASAPPAYYVDQSA